MKISKLISVLLLVTLLLAMTAGCASTAATTTAAATAATTAAAAETTAAADQKIVIGVTMESLQDFLSYVGDGLNDFAKANPNVEINILDAKLDVATQVKQVESFISQGVDAIIIKCVDKDATAPISAMCKDAGIPLIAVNVDIGSDREAYVGSDHKLSGVLEAEELAKQMNYKGNVAILVGDPSHNAAQTRTDGAKEVFAKYPDMKVVAEQSGMWDRAKSITIAENWIQSGLEINAIIANNDEMAIGALKAYEQAKITNVLFAGIDGTKDALSYMQEGKLALSVFQNGYEQGFKAAETATKLAMGETLSEPYVDVAYELITPDKIDMYLAKYK
ncbi:MAG: substrate-binding domain-containing protein [Eubacteriales bacterium]|nr:substrate-binding domain-containing protein [Eubacteriales bacterium]